MPPAVRRVALVLAILVGALARPLATTAAQPEGAPANQPVVVPAECRTLMTIDSPSPGAIVSSEVLVRGWALDTMQPDGSGIQQIHVYLDGEAGQGRLLGAASLGQFRPDVDAAFDRPSSQPGWGYTLTLASIAPGLHQLYVYAQDACGWQFSVLPVRVNPTLIVVDRPASPSTPVDANDFAFVGWAVDPTTANGSGIDAVHVYLDGEAGSAPAVGAATLGPRPDVASVLGRPSVSRPGFSLATRLPALPGAHTLFVYAHSATEGWSYRTVSVEVAEPMIAYSAPPPGRLLPPGATGYDVSWPNCEGPLPALPYQLAIVGVTGGRAFYQNRCLASQFAWARAAATAPSLYMNLNAPIGRAAGRGDIGPAGDCRIVELPCRSYNFGFNAALHAVAYARSQRINATFGGWISRPRIAGGRTPP